MLRSVEIELPVKLSPPFANTFSVIGNYMRTLLQITFLLISIACFGQTKEQKIEFILKTNGSIDGYKSILLDMTINPMKNSASKTDSLKLVAIEKKLTNSEINRRLSKSFAEVFTDKEIDDIYNFYNTSAGKKMINSYENLDEKYRSSFEDINSELKSILERSNSQYKTENKPREIPITVDKEDGFYTIINYEGNDYELKNLKLAPKVAVSKSEISEVKLLKDELGRNVIDIKLTKEGGNKFKILTENNIGKPIAIVLNKKLISAPRVLDVISEGRIQIIGNFSDEEVKEIVNAVKIK